MSGLSQVLRIAVLDFGRSYNAWRGDYESDSTSNDITYYTEHTDLGLN